MAALTAVILSTFDKHLTESLHVSSVGIPPPKNPHSGHLARPGLETRRHVTTGPDSTDPLPAHRPAPPAVRGARPSVAVVGSGVAGLTAAHLLSRTHDVVLFEAEDRWGGHAHTHHLVGASGVRHAVDSGFIVHNDRTYPALRRLFAELEVAVRPTEMSMSVRCRGCGLEYAGGRGAGGILAQGRRAVDPSFVRMLVQVKRFHRVAGAFLRSGDDRTTYGEFLAGNGFDAYFIAHYAVPVVSCVWSTGRALSLEYPAHYLFRFLEHHGMLSVGNSPQWFTVQGGSAVYVQRIVERLPDVRSGCPVVHVNRTSEGVQIHDATGRRTTVDRVVIATHPDQALDLLADPTQLEIDTLKAFVYSRNSAVLHTDTSILPNAPRARASWNYSMSECWVADAPTQVTYWSNRLQGITESDPYLVTLNDGDRIASEAVLARMEYTHPVYTREVIAAQARLPQLATDRTVFAGAYHGFGFHEDGCASGVAAAAHFGVHW